MIDKVSVKSSSDLIEHLLITVFKVQMLSAIIDCESLHELSIVRCLSCCAGEFLFTAANSENSFFLGLKKLFFFSSGSSCLFLFPLTVNFERPPERSSIT